MNDPIADLLNRINNAKGAGKEQVEIPYSSVKENVLKVLHSEGYVGEYTLEKDTATLVVDLKSANKSFKNMVRYSRPGRRVYVTSRRIPRPKSGFGMVVISTPLGVLSGHSARKSGVGGEVICEVF